MIGWLKIYEFVGVFLGKQGDWGVYIIMLLFFCGVCEEVEWINVWIEFIDGVWLVELFVWY